MAIISNILDKFNHAIKIDFMHGKPKGSGSRRTRLAMIFILAESESKSWKRLEGYDKLESVDKGCTFKDGELQQDIAGLNFSEHNF